MKFIKQILAGCMVLIAINATCFAMADAGGPADAAQGAPVAVEAPRPDVGEFVTLVFNRGAKNEKRVKIKKEVALKSGTLKTMIENIGISDAGFGMPDDISSDDVKYIFGFEALGGDRHYVDGFLTAPDEFFREFSRLDQESAISLIKTAHCFDIQIKRRSDEMLSSKYFLKNQTDTFPGGKKEIVMFNISVDGSLLAVISRDSSYSPYILSLFATKAKQYGCLDKIWEKELNLNYVRQPARVRRLDMELDTISKMDFTSDGSLLVLVIKRSNTRLPVELRRPPEERVIFDTRTGKIIHVPDHEIDIHPSSLHKTTYGNYQSSGDLRYLEVMFDRSCRSNSVGDFEEITYDNYQPRGLLSLGGDKFAVLHRKTVKSLARPNKPSETLYNIHMISITHFNSLDQALLFEIWSKPPYFEENLKKLATMLSTQQPFDTDFVPGLSLGLVVNILRSLNTEFLRKLPHNIYGLIQKLSNEELAKGADLEKGHQQFIHERYKDEFERREMIRQENLRKQQQVEDESKAIEKASQRTPTQIREAVRPFADREADENREKFDERIKMERAIRKEKARQEETSFEEDDQS